MAATSPRGPDTAPVYDLVGIGFGPANLSLACAIDEWNAGAARPMRALFLERKPAFGWYPDLLFPDASCQVAFVKDLATTRDPRSRYTFLNYLHRHDRLHQFFDLGELVPSREEFHRYFTWAADEVAGMVSYGQTAESVELDTEARPQLLRIRAAGQDGTAYTLRCRNAVLAVGGEPSVPQGIPLEPGGRVFHSGTFLSRFRAHCPDPAAPYRVLIVGSGQSAADIMVYLLGSHPNVSVTLATRSFSFRAVDANPFVNEFFLPRTIDFLYDLPPEIRHRLNEEFYGTGYGIVDGNTLQALYRQLYAERARGTDRVEILSLAELAEVREEPAGVHVELTQRHADGPVTRRADVVVLATGYTRTSRLDLLKPLTGLVKRNDFDEIVTDRQYRAVGLGDGSAGLYLQGLAATTHGIGDEALSNVATRAGTALAALTGERGH